jgi:hypothetical protein
VEVNAMHMKPAAIVALAVVLPGCAIRQTVNPVAPVASREVCVIENQKVKEGFLESYRRALTTKGYVLQQLASSAAITACPITSTYVAHWNWDLAVYMSYAEIRVFRDGQPAGDAIYDSRRGSSNMGKFINAESKVEELVNQLFPGAPTQ